MLEEGGGVAVGREDVDFERVVEVCGDLREVVMVPSSVLFQAAVSGGQAHVHGKRDRVRIPVEKSGGGI